MKIKILTLCLLSILTTVQAYAGWYECYTYKGKLAGADIHLYLQLMEINSSTKDSILVSGVYKYDKQNTPIELRGVLIKNSLLVLKEYINNKPNAELKINWSKENSLQSTWGAIGSSKSFRLALEKIGQLIDTDEDRSNVYTEILMETSFTGEYLVGGYIKNKDERKARMVELKIYDKKTNQELQRISFLEHPRPVGNLATVIFGNAYASEVEDLDIKEIETMEDDGRMGQELYLFFDKKSNKYIIKE
jgi:hypothetical protein